MTELTVDPAAVRVLVLDPEPARRDLVRQTLEEAGYRVIGAVSSPAELVWRDGPAPDLVIADLDADGSEVVAELRSVSLPDVPVLGLTADGSAQGRRRAAESGVADFLLRPIELVELQLRISTIHAGGRVRRLLADRSARLTEALRDHSAEIGTTRESLSILAAVADFHDDDSNQHAQRVGIVATAIGRALALPEPLTEMLGEAAALHDIGKVGISRRILLKPGKLTPPEWMHMMQHVDIGGQILASAQSPVLRLAGEIARTHHERWDGSGYTAGLAGEEIPISGRIVAVADVWDTLTHDRPYRKAWEPERALAEIRAQSGAHFDPAVVEAFCGFHLEPLEQADGSDRVAA